MRFTIFTLTLLPLATALPKLVHRATDLGPQVRSQIDVLNSSVIELTSAVNNFDGSLLGVVPQSLAVVTAEAKLDATTLKITHLAKQSDSFTEPESESIVTTLATLIGPIQGSLTALTNKYPEFKKTLEAPIVLLDLKTLKKHTDDLLAALTPKVTESWAGYLTLGQGILDQAFDDAIAVYSK
ncbi:hypothetical protein EJ04DRAFT_476766 [Polyplosphaeria fusca]|uniref:Hydrophobic surface binding protein A-domain-containing protein n=1 Tax=Polyplosphaeria fusca TaxID=682080 RepID=A0A9P4QLZ2_9PLEO|nr:hypothetical protein EJ04DRAFT_476766 [Polyplosphaeria fusca]